MLQIDGQYRVWDEATQQEIPKTPGDTSFYDPYYLRKDDIDQQYVTGPVNFANNGFSVGTNQVVTSGGRTGFGRTPVAYTVEVQGDVQATGSFRGDGSQLSNVAAVTATSATTAATATSANAYKGNSTPSAAQFGFLDPTSSIQGQLNAKEGSIAAGLSGQYWTGLKTWANLTTAVVTENTNLYWTQTRFDTAFGLKSTSSLTEGSNLYWTQGRFDTAFGLKSTSNLTEGSNLYFTNARARSALSSASVNRIVYDATAGTISTPQDIHTSATPTFSSLFMGANGFRVTTAGTTYGRLLSVTADWVGLTQNGAFNGAAWLLDDTTKVGWFAKADSRASFQEYAVYKIPIGANPHTNEYAVFSISGATDRAYFSGAVSIGTTNPDTYKLYVTGTSYFNGAQTVNGDMLLAASTANLYLKDASTGFSVGTTTVINLLNNNNLRSSTFTSGVVGWGIASAGNAEFNNIRARGEFAASVFKVSEITASGGTWMQSYSAATLSASMTTAAALGGSFTLTLKNSDAGGALASVGHVLQIKTFTGSATISQMYATVTAVVNNGTTSTVTATLNSGSTSTTYQAGTGVVNLGPSGTGVISLSSDGTIGSSPNLSMWTHAGSPWTTQTMLLRLGNMNGSYSYASNVYGFGVGQYGIANTPWLTVDTTSGIRIGGGAAGTTTLAQWDISGNVLVGSASGSNVYITSTALALRAGATARSSFNTDGSGWLANTAVSWNTAGTFTVTGSASIGGWSVTSTSFTKNEVVIAAGVDPVAAATDSAAAWFGKSASGYVGLDLRRNTSGVETLLRLNTGNGTLRPYMLLYDGTRGRVAIGELNATYHSGDVASAGIGMKVWDASGNKLVEFSDVRNVLSGWTVGTGSITSTGITMASGASAYLAFGTTPPTSATVGTGLFLNQTGLYGLASNVQQAKFDAATGKITAGAGAVSLDAAGINIVAPTSFITANSVKWVNNISQNVAAVAAGYSASDGYYHSQTQISATSYNTAGGISTAYLAAYNTTDACYISVTKFATLYSAPPAGAPNFGEIKIVGESVSIYPSSGSGWTTTSVNITGTLGVSSTVTVAGAFSVATNVLTANSIAGRVGIGTASPTTALHVVGTFRLASLGAGTLVTDALGNVSISSDARLKTDRRPFIRGSAALLGIKPETFRWTIESKMDTSRDYTALIAQNLRDYIPEAVSTDSRNYYTVDDRPILATVINATNEHTEEIKTLRAEIAALRAELAKRPVR